MINTPGSKKLQHVKVIFYFLLLLFCMAAIFPSQRLFAAKAGVTWKKRDSGTTKGLRGVTYGNSTFVAVGDEGTILTSADGVIWTTKASGDTAHLRGVTYGNSTFVAVDDGGTILTSADGVIWTTRASDIAWELSGVTYGNSTFVAVGAPDQEGYGYFGDGIFTSADGVTWTAAEDSFDDSLQAVTYGNSTFVAVGWWYGSIITSPDGVTWTSRSYDTDDMLFGVAYGNSTFVAAGNWGKIITSPDGVTWTYRSSGTSHDFYGVTYGNSTFVAVGKSLSHGEIRTSADGVTWKKRVSGTANGLHAVTYGNSTFVSVGDDGTILQSGSTKCNAKVTFLDEEDTSREVSGAAADGESQVVIQISNLCDNISEKDIKITIPESDGTLGKKEFKDGVFTQIWKAPENFVREGQNEDLETGKRELDFQITIQGEEVSTPDFYLFKPPVVLVHGIWADAGSLNGMMEYLKKHYSEWVNRFTYPNSRHFADNVATVGGWISGTINTMKNQEIESLENPIVVKKADVVAHSMGGILTGLYIASNGYENNINRLVTIGTPHSGSELANFTLHFVYDEMTSEERTEFFNGPYYKIFKNFGGIKRSFTEGAVEDLQVGSSAMEDYRKGWQNVQKAPPVYAIQGKPQGESPSLVTDLFAYGGKELSKYTTTVLHGIGLWYWDCTLDRSTWYFEGANAEPEDDSLYKSLNIEAGLFGSKKSSDFVVSLKSQKGGSSAYDTIEVEDHTTETDDSEVQEKVAELLNSSIDKFDKNGFSPPADYPVPKVGVVTIDQETNSQSKYKARALNADGTSTSKLNITSPEEGEVFSPGDTVTVEVTYDGQPKNGIYLLSQDGAIGVDDSAPYEFQFQIDEEFIGSMLIVVWAVNEEGGIEEGSVEIRIETDDKPESISITPSGPLYIERGTEVMLYVEGTYPDGVTRDITSHAAGTSYSSADSSIASVTEDGVITAVSVGETTITVENGASAEYKVYVLSCNAKKISVSEKTLTLKRKESKNVTVTLTGNDGCLSEGKTVTTSINKAGQKRITISSTSTAVDSNGQGVFTITANNKKTGKAKVTFKSGKLKKSLTVKVTK